MSENYEDFEEEVTEDDQRNAMLGKTPIGYYVCDVVDRAWIEMDFTNPKVMGIQYDLKIVETHEGDPATKFDYAGRILKSDKIPMPPPPGDYTAEQQKGIERGRKKRVRVATVSGALAASPSGKMNKAMWEDVVGRRVIIHWDDQQSLNKETGKWEPNGFQAVSPFDGWQPAETPKPEIDPEDI